MYKLVAVTGCAIALMLPALACAESPSAANGYGAEVVGEMTRTPSPYTWSVGFELGADLAHGSISTQDIGGNFSSSETTGFLVGARVDYELSALWGLEAGLRYDQRSLSGAYVIQNPASSTSASANLSWLEIPVLAKLNLGIGNGWPYLFSGPELGFRLSDSETAVFPPNAVHPLGNAIGSTNISWIFGLGVPFGLGDGRTGFARLAYVSGLNQLWSANTMFKGVAILDSFLITAGMNFSI